MDVTEKGFFVIKSAPKKKSLFPYTESQLLKALNDGQDRTHLLATPLKPRKSG